MIYSKALFRIITFRYVLTAFYTTVYDAKRPPVVCQKPHRAPGIVPEIIEMIMAAGERSRAKHYEHTFAQHTFRIALNGSTSRTITIHCR